MNTLAQHYVSDERPDGPRVTLYFATELKREKAARRGLTRES